MSCPIKLTAPVKGFTYATPARPNGSKIGSSGSGATVVFRKSSSIGGLNFADNPATLTGVLTFKGSFRQRAHLDNNGISIDGPVGAGSSDLMECVLLTGLGR